MESLLRWSIENAPANAGQQSQEPTPPPRTDLDPAIIDHILGKPEAEQMKEALAIAQDESREEDERVLALDDFEMLVESIDNANDLEKLRMWEPLQSLLTSDSTSEMIKVQTLWIVGTAVQNNPAAQAAYLSLSPVASLLSFVSPSAGSAKLRSKAVYALSGLLKHNAAAVKQLQAANGWEILRAALEDSDISVRRKAAFLLNILLIPTTPVEPEVASDTSAPDVQHAQRESAAPVHPNSHASMISDPTSFSTSALAIRAMEERGLLQASINALTSPVPHGPDGEILSDADFEEKLVSVLYTYAIACGGRLSAGQKSTLGDFLSEQSKKSEGDAQLAERWGLTVDEVESLRRAVS